MMTMRALLTTMTTALLAAALSTATATADNLPKGFVAVPDSVSPDGTLQVIIPTVATDTDVPPCQTRLVNVATGKLIALIKGECAFEHQNQSSLHPRWSKDGSTLIWHADNKWGSSNVQILQIKDGAVTNQLDVRTPTVKQLLAAVKKSQPKQYAAAKKNSKGLGSWFRDGLSIDVRPVIASDGVQWPIAFMIDVTSDPKCSFVTPTLRVGGTMKATLSAARKWTFASFDIGHAACGKDGELCAFSDCE
jgi:hypothetical protein